jgi:hypothetical protein
MYYLRILYYQFLMAIIYIDYIFLHDLISKNSKFKLFMISVIQFLIEIKIKSTL